MHALDISDGAVTESKIALGAVTVTKLRNSSVTPGKLALGAVGTNQLADGAVTAAKVGEQCAAGEVLKFDGTAWACAPDDSGVVDQAPPEGVRFENWRIVRTFDPTDTSLKGLVDEFALGGRTAQPTDVVSLVYLDREGLEVRRVDCFGFVPVRYGFIDFDNISVPLPLEVVELSVQRCEYSGTGSLQQLTANTFRLELEGISGERVQTVEPGAMVNVPRESPSPLGPGSRVVAGLSPAALQPGVIIAGFVFALLQGGVPAGGDWTSIEGGARAFETNESGKVVEKVTDVELVGALLGSPTRFEMMQWLNDWTGGRTPTGTATLELEDRDRVLLKTIQFRDIVPISYQPPAVQADSTAVLEETLVFRPQAVVEQ